MSSLITGLCSLIESQGGAWGTELITFIHKANRMGLSGRVVWSTQLSNLNTKSHLQKEISALENKGINFRKTPLFLNTLTCGNSLVCKC